MSTPSGTGSSHPQKPTFSSPAPRSVPSPATHRTQAGKSPFNPSNQAQSSSALPAGNHPTGSSTGAGKLIGSSPAPGGLDFNSPAALGLSLGNLADGGVGMNISMSGMSGLGGLTGSIGGRGDDGEMRKRLEEVITTLATRPGRLCIDTVEKLSKRYRLEVLKEDPKRDGSQVVTIASPNSTVLIEAKFRHINVDQVTLSYSYEGASEAVTAHANAASNTLRANLTPPPGVSSLNYELHLFDKNLERLSRLDKLSKPEANCFEAVAGVYSSLRRLFQHEKKAAMALLDPSRPNAEARAEREVLCKKSGRPKMNVNGAIGLSLEYWMDRRTFFSPKSQPANPCESAGNEDIMDIDQPIGEVYGKANSVYSLVIECESSLAELYPPIRVSNAWVSETIETADLLGQPTIDWLDPPPTYLTPPNIAQADALSLDPTAMAKRPDVRFVAKFNPPIVVPLATANSLYHSVSSQISEETIKATTFDGLVLGHPPIDRAIGALVSDINREHRRERTVLLRDGSLRRHATRLFVPKLEYAMVVEELPFEHPRQLVQMLPILRQYAMLTCLLKNTLPPPPRPPLSQSLKAAGPSKPLSTLSLDMSLTIATSDPHLTLVIPPPPSLNPDSSPPMATAETLTSLLASADPSGPKPRLLSVAILSNGDLAIATGEQQGSVDAGVGVEGKALEFLGDLGVWAEWLAERR